MEQKESILKTLKLTMNVNDEVKVDLGVEEDEVDELNLRYKRKKKEIKKD